jgi:hypothetical protein
MKQQTSNWLYNRIVGNFMSWFIAVTIMSFYVNEWTQSPWIMVIGLFVGSFWTINLHAYYEAYRIEVGKEEIDHISRFVVRLVLAIVISQLIHVLAFGFTNRMKLPMAIGVLYLGAIFWLLFDFMLNYHRGKEILYVSSYYRTSKIDKFFRRFSDNTRLLLWVGSKVVVFVLASWAYYKVIQ